jgi:hypothetical protein
MTDETFDFSKYEEEVQEESNSTPRILTDDMLRRRMIWSIAPCHDVSEIIQATDLPPVSDDVEDQEHQDAHARLALVHSYMGLMISALTMYASEAIQVTLLSEAEKQRGEPGVTDEALEAIISHPLLQLEALHPLIFNAVSAVLSEMLDVGAIFIATPRLIDVVRDARGKEQSPSE